jgi:hypothetical protein
MHAAFLFHSGRNMRKPTRSLSLVGLLSAILPVAAAGPGGPADFGDLPNPTTPGDR